VVGTRSRIGCLSFFPTKNLGCFGDGGAIMSNDQDLANRISRLRVHGMEPKYVHAEVGINGRLDALQAAVLEVKLKYLEQWHQNRADNAARYTALFSEAGASIGAGNAHQSNLPLDIPAPPDGPARHVWNQFVIRVPAALRESLRAHLAENDIGSEVYYQIPLHMQACFAEQFVEQPLPETERACEEVLALPVFPGLTASQIETTASTVINWLRGH
jgi:dTDP-4-amino-4,6-dideoxygalactose transaminase